MFIIRYISKDGVPRIETIKAESRMDAMNKANPKTGEMVEELNPV